MADSGADDSDKKRTQPPAIEFLRPGEQAASPPPQQPVAWVPRPEDYQRPTYAAPTAAPSAPSRYARVAGVLLIIAGIMGFLYTFSVFMLPLTLSDFYNLTNQSQAEVASNSLLSIAIIYSQVLAFVGGALSLQRKSWKLAVACAFLSMLGIGVLFLESVLSVVAAMLLIRARAEFSS